MSWRALERVGAGWLGFRDVDAEDQHCEESLISLYFNHTWRKHHGKYLLQEVQVIGRTTVFWVNRKRGVGISVLFS